MLAKHNIILENFIVCIALSMNVLEYYLRIFTRTLSFFVVQLNRNNADSISVALEIS
jgi:hypothetical protein